MEGEFSPRASLLALLPASDPLSQGEILPLVPLGPSACGFELKSSPRPRCWGKFRVHPCRWGDMTIQLAGLCVLPGELLDKVASVNTALEQPWRRGNCSHCQRPRSQAVSGFEKAKPWAQAWSFWGHHDLLQSELLGLQFSRLCQGRWGQPAVHVYARHTHVTWHIRQHQAPGWMLAGVLARTFWEISPGPLCICSVGYTVTLKRGS